MIQRVQSVYLLLVTVLMSFLLIRPYAEQTVTKDQVLTFRTYAIKINTGNNASAVYKTTVPVIAMVLITSLLSFASIFFYNRRIIQIRLCIVNSILLVALLITMFFYYSSTRGSLTVVYQTFKIPAIFPLLCIVFNLMAYKAIRHDELLVNSYNRMR
jgi:hypothetical protein